MATSTALAPTAIFDSLSEDEDSFEVLGFSMTPSLCSHNPVNVKEEKPDNLINGGVIEEAIDIVQGHLSDLSDSTVVGFPSIPKVSNHDLVPLVEQLYLSTTTTNSSVELSPDEIQHKVDLLIEENIKLKEILHQNNMAMKDQYETLLAWQEEVMKVHQSHREKFADTKKYIENLKIENTTLSQALAAEKAKLQSKEIASLETRDLINCNLKAFELDSALNKILVLEAEIKLLKNEQLSHIELQSSLTTQNENLQKELDSIKQEVTTYVKQLQQSDSIQNILLDEIKTMKAKNSDHSKCKTAEALDNIQEQLMESQMHITKLQELHNNDKDSINDKETLIKKLQTEISENKETIQKLQREISENVDTICALQHQVNACTSDFEEQRLALSAITETNTKNENDLRHLQRSNSQLLEEVERLRKDGYIYVGRSENASVSDATAEKVTFECPKCTLKFTDYNILENHVFRCINIDSMF